MSGKSIIREYEIPENGVDLQQVLLLCEPHMVSLCDQKPAEGWMDYSFRYLLAEYFPENFAVEKIPGADRAVDYFTGVLTKLFERERAEKPFDPCRDFALLREEEAQYCSIPEEYNRLRE